MPGDSAMDDLTSYAETLLVGQRVRLRALVEDDVVPLERWWQDPSMMPLQRDQVLPQPVGPGGEVLRGWSTNDSPGSVGFSVVDVVEDRLVGHATLHGATVRTRCATLAVMIGDGHTGRGYGSDAVRVLVRYGFEEMGLHRVELATAASNDRALATYRAAGFVEEGRRRQVSFHAGRFHDEVLMSLLADEWRAAQR